MAGHCPGALLCRYLDPVEEQGGCFTVVPGQHKSVWRYFCENPAQIDGSFQRTVTYQERGWRALYESEGGADADENGGGDRPSFQFVGDAGSVLFWHGYIPHW